LIEGDEAALDELGDRPCGSLRVCRMHLSPRRRFNDLCATTAISLFEAGASIDALRAAPGWKSRDVVERDINDLPLAR
jgi:hypothetical protein